MRNVKIWGVTLSFISDLCREKTKRGAQNDDTLSGQSNLSFTITHKAPITTAADDSFTDISIKFWGK